MLACHRHVERACKTCLPRLQSGLPDAVRLAGPARGRPAGGIRERELGWTAEEQRNSRQIYKPSVKVQAVMLDEREGESPELSIRLARADSWLTLTDRTRPGQLVMGVVAAVQPCSIFVELQPGVTGLLHHTNLPTWCKRSIGDVF